MLVSALMSLLGFATIGIIWTVRGESLLNISNFYNNEAEVMRHRRAGAVQRRAQHWLISHNNDTEGMRHRRVGAEEEQVLRWLKSYTNKTEGMRHRRDVGLKPGAMLWGNDIRAEWLKAHNDIRRDSTKILGKKQPEASNMMRMYWNGYLEASALAWAWFNCKDWRHGQDDKVVKHPKFKKQLGKYIFWDFIGQNIEWYTPPRRPPKVIMQGYGSETMNYDYHGEKGKCKPGTACGHYTQITWFNSFFIGCGYAACPNNRFTSVCNFLPGGNSGDNPPYIPGKPCSGCSGIKTYGKTFSSCQINLCAPKDPCAAVIDCKVTDKSNCLCDDEVYHKLVKEIWPKDIPINEKYGKAKPDPNSARKGPGKTGIAVVSDLLLPFVVILLGHGVQLVFQSGLL